ncbi:MAG: RNA 2',3'-cyclic phosphodiesterase [Acholeplasmataceae bacterium]|nr:RNA 2',3'-cyclic phosphodiesterase [Acholeplasmataceae bacterium]
MRLFIGIPMPEGVKFYLRETQQHLIQHAIKKKPTLLENFHLTLLFLGEMDGAMIDDICQSLENHVKDIKPFMIQLGDVGSFIRAKNQILWVGIKEGIQQLGILSQRVRLAMDMISVDYENKTFTPHITLAREVQFGDSKNTFMIHTYDTAISVDYFNVYKSHRVDGILTYTPLCKILL